MSKVRACPTCGGQMLLDRRTFVYSCQRSTAFCQLNVTARWVKERGCAT